MHYIIQGCHADRSYEIIKGNGKPYFHYDDKFTWETIFEFDNEKSLKELLVYDIRLYVGDLEWYHVLDYKFRADLNATVVHILKELSVVGNKESKQEEYNIALKEYYNSILEKYPEVKRHIDIYNPKDPMENIDDIVKNVVKQTERNFTIGSPSITAYSTISGDQIFSGTISLT